MERHYHAEMSAGLLLFFRSFQHTTFFLHARIRLYFHLVILQPDAVQRIGEAFQGLLPPLGFQLTLPDGDAVPAHLGQRLLLFNIPLLISPDLRHPELPVRLRNLTALRINNGPWSMVNGQ